MRKVQKPMAYPLYASCKVLKIYGLTVRIRVLDVLTFDRVSLYKSPVNLLESRRGLWRWPCMAHSLRNLRDHELAHMVFACTGPGSHQQC
jgi:hypothetical protein